MFDVEKIVKTLNFAKAKKPLKLQKKLKTTKSQQKQKTKGVLIKYIFSGFHKEQENLRLLLYAFNFYNSKKILQFINFCPVKFMFNFK